MHLHIGDAGARCGAIQKGAPSASAYPVFSHASTRSCHPGAEFLFSMSVNLHDRRWRRFVALFLAAPVLLAAFPTAAQPGSGAAVTLSKLPKLRPGEWLELPDTR